MMTDKDGAKCICKALLKEAEDKDGMRVGHINQLESNLKASLAREAALQEELERLKREAEQDTTIDERDRYHEIADSLALAISKHFRVEIGEHSSMNCPWSVALEVMNGAYITDTNEGRERDALQQRLTYAEKRLSTFESLMLESNELLYVIRDGLGPNLGAEVETMRGKVFTALKLAEGEGS